METEELVKESNKEIEEGEEKLERQCRNIRNTNMPPFLHLLQVKQAIATSLPPTYGTMSDKGPLIMFAGNDALISQHSYSLIWPKGSEFFSFRVRKNLRDSAETSEILTCLHLLQVKQAIATSLPPTYGTMSDKGPLIMFAGNDALISQHSYGFIWLEGSKFFSFRVQAASEGRQNYFDRFTSPENVGTSLKRPIMRKNIGTASHGFHRQWM